MDLLIVRIIFVILVGLACYILHPFGLTPVPDLAVGLTIGLAIVLFELRLRLVSLKRLIGAAIGSILGIIGASVNRAIVTALSTQRFLNAFDECGTFFFAQNGSCLR